MPNRYSSILETLNAVKVVLRWEVVLTALAVSTIALELQTGLVLKTMQNPHTAWPVFSAVLLQSLVFVVFCWGFYSIAAEVFSSLHLPAEESESFVKVVREKPFSFMVLPVIFVFLFLLIFIVQTGLVAMIERFELPVWLYPLFYLLQFAAATANVILGAYVLINLFLWFPHVYSRNYKFSSLIRSFHSLLAHNTYRALLHTAMWVVITFLVFSYFLFPVWKMCVTETLEASRIALAERFENEVTGRDTFLSDIVDSLTDENLTPIATYNALSARLNSRQQADSVDPFRFRDLPTAGLLFLAALVLTLGLPVGIALALYSAAGSYSYRLILEAATRQADSGMFRQLTQREAARLERHMQGEPTVNQTQPDAPPPREDQFIEEIPVEPDASSSARRRRISPLEPKDEQDPNEKKTDHPAGSPEEALERYVDYDYRKQTDPGGKKFGSSNGKPKDKKQPDKPPRDESKRNFIRERKPQKAPKKKPPEDDGEDYTIFDEMDDM